MEKLIKARYLKQYVRIFKGHEETTQEAPKQTLNSPIAPKSVINYIHNGPKDDKYHSRW